jgi:ATP-binding cassette subfamily B protein
MVPSEGIAMSMESAAWSSLYKISSARDGKHGFSRESVRRILTFAVPYRAKLVIFIALSVVGAFLAVATPVLGGQVVNVIVARVRSTRSCGSPSSSPSWP